MNLALGILRQLQSSIINIIQKNGLSEGAFL